MQSLVLLNDPTYVEAARALATKVLSEVEGNDDARIATAFRRAVGRAPDDEEAAALTKLLTQQRARYAEDEAAAKSLISVGELPLPEDVPPAELAAWTNVCRVV